MNTICPFPSLRCLLFASLMIMVMALASCVAEEPEAADDGSSVVRMDLRLPYRNFPRVPHLRMSMLWKTPSTGPIC